MFVSLVDPSHSPIRN
uniref:Uncharacterized protein n=1 Tax=Vitis vinifera TaxID=29760 RepID=F6HPX9_VITVI